MAASKTTRTNLAIILLTGVAVLALVGTRQPAAEMSEIDAFQRAVSSQTKADALAFLRDFGSSHLAPDLIDVLPQGVASEVCATISESSSRADAACKKVGAPTLVGVSASATQPTNTAPTASASNCDSVAAVPESSWTGVVEVVEPPVTANASPAPNKGKESTLRLMTKSARSSLVASAQTRQVATLARVPEMPIADPKRKTLSDNAVTVRLRTLAARFNRSPFQVGYIGSGSRDVLISYSGGLGRFVSCGETIGVPSPIPSDGARDQLLSRMTIHVGDDNHVSINVAHTVTLFVPSSGSPNLANVRSDRPGRASDGRYCWSTGEMELLARKE
jgi:hypothetical protein